jgi:hypothetical protein
MVIVECVWTPFVVAGWRSQQLLGVPFNFVIQWSRWSLFFARRTRELVDRRRINQQRCSVSIPILQQLGRPYWNWYRRMVVEQLVGIPFKFIGIPLVFAGRSYQQFSLSGSKQLILGLSGRKELIACPASVLFRFPREQFILGLPSRWQLIACSSRKLFRLSREQQHTLLGEHHNHPLELGHRRASIIILACSSRFFLRLREQQWSVGIPWKQFISRRTNFVLWSTK